AVRTQRDADRRPLKGGQDGARTGDDVPGPRAVSRYPHRAVRAGDRDRHQVRVRVAGAVVLDLDQDAPTAGRHVGRVRPVDAQFGVCADGRVHGRADLGGQVLQGDREGGRVVEVGRRVEV